MTSARIRPEAQTGFAAAAAYDAGRPTYRAEAVDLLLGKLDLAGVQGAKILDLAAGTGKFTEALSARPEEYEIVAVEPHDDMRQQLSDKKLHRVTVVDGSAEDLEHISDGTFAAVLVAQVRCLSLIWWLHADMSSISPFTGALRTVPPRACSLMVNSRFANMNALKEIARVLRPAGVLGLIWNIDDCTRPIPTSPPYSSRQTMPQKRGTSMRVGVPRCETLCGLLKTINLVFDMSNGGKSLMSRLVRTLLHFTSPTLFFHCQSEKPLSTSKPGCRQMTSGAD